MSETEQAASREALADLIGSGYNGMNFRWMEPHEPKRAWLLDAADAVLQNYVLAPRHQDTWVHCSPEGIRLGLDCAHAPRRKCGCSPTNGGHDHPEREGVL